jgi:hypothetical protein
MKAYTLKKKKDSEEYHLFEGDFSQDTCTSQNESICGKMKKSESIGNKFQCLKEQQARTEIAKIGRQVCGVCTSHLYTTFE